MILENSILIKNINKVFQTKNIKEHLLQRRKNKCFILIQTLDKYLKHKNKLFGEK